MKIFLDIPHYPLKAREAVFGNVTVKHEALDPRAIAWANAIAPQIELDVRLNLIDRGMGHLQDEIIPLLPKILAYRASYKQRGRIPAGVRAKVLSAGKCVWCGSTENLAVDHIYPYSLGGSDDIENLQCLCRSCNSRKSNKVL